jgi:DNA-binding transcriptional LysR family regulator
MLHSRMLRYLDEVARCGSIRKAADHLNVAASAINRQILALEEEIGEPIFERMPRRLRLTATGEILIEHVRQTLKDYARVGGRLTALKGVEQGRVKISTTLGLAAGPFANIVGDFVDRHPRVQVNVRALFAEAIPNSVISGDIDLGLGFNFQPDRALRTLMTFDVPLGAVVAPSHELAGEKNVKLVDVIQYPLVMAEAGMSLRSIVDQAMNRVSLLARPTIETNSVELMKKFIRQRPRAVTFLNPLDVAEECASGSLVFVSLAETSMRAQPLRLVARAKGMLDPVTSRFAEELRSALNGLTEARP